MSTILQISLILASIAVVAFVGCVLPMLFIAKRKIEQFGVAQDQVRANINELVRECRELTGHLTKLTERVETELDEVSQVVHTVHDWTDRANGAMKDVGEFVEPLMRNVNRFRTIFSVISSIFNGQKLPQSS